MEFEFPPQNALPDEVTFNTHQAVLCTSEVKPWEFFDK